MQRFLILFLLTTACLGAQGQQLDPNDYIYPLRELKQRLYSANFGEIRPGHFHAGVDIKTDAEEGKPVVAAADGYVSRVVLQAGGYGRAVYLTLRNGTTVVYGHLRRFRDDIERHVRRERYERRSNGVNLWFGPGTWPVKQGDVVAYSGDSGSSGGPHLHYEIRDTETQRLYNPVREGIIRPRDEYPPRIVRLHYVEVDTVQGVPVRSVPESYAVVRTAAGRYALTHDGPVGVGRRGYFVAEVTDRRNDVWNTFGVWRVTAFADGIPCFEFRMDSFTYDISRCSDAVSCYPIQINSRNEAIRLAQLEGAPDSFYPTMAERGLIRTAEDLVRFADDVNNGQQNLNALQTADIDLGGIDNWKPIGMQYPGDPRPFLGIYNGNGYTISHLKISDMQDGIAAGLFGRTDSDALLTGIHLRDVKISIRNKASTVGTLVGISRGASTVSLCSAQGIINTSDIEPTVGGLVGLNEGTITRCRTDVEITVDRVRLSGQRSAYAGGIIGRNDYSGLLFACHAIGNITMKGNASNGNPTMRVGGIAGRNEINYTLNSTIHCCIAEGDVSVTSESADIDIYAGGLVGYNDGGDVKSCYARGTAIANTVETPTGKRMAGAIVGYMWNNNVQSCYGAGVGGQGTSNCVGNTYNTTPGEGDIRKIITNSLSTHGTITGYDPLATPAYGIDISRSASVRSSSFWLAGDGTWPVLDFTRNTLN